MHSYSSRARNSQATEREERRARLSLARCQWAGRWRNGHCVVSGDAAWPREHICPELGQLALQGVAASRRSAWPRRCRLEPNQLEGGRTSGTAEPGGPNRPHSIMRRHGRCCLTLKAIRTRSTTPRHALPRRLEQYRRSCQMSSLNTQTRTRRMNKNMAPRTG
jgi:hypothetical protein